MEKEERTPEEDIEHCRHKVAIAAENMIAAQGLVIRNQDKTIVKQKAMLRQNAIRVFLRCFLCTVAGLIVGFALAAVVLT